MGQTRPFKFIFVLFLIQWQIEYNIWLYKNVDGVPGIWTRDYMMAGTHKSTDLCRYPLLISFLVEL